MRYRNYFLYYNYWWPSIVEHVNMYDMVVIKPEVGPEPLSSQASIVSQIKLGLDGKLGTSDDVTVLGYISLGEDLGTMGGAAPYTGDGSGPCYLNVTTMNKVCANAGVASFYLEHGPEDNGVPVRHSTWGGCYVDAGDANWPKYLLGRNRDGNMHPYGADQIIAQGYDGLFLDAPDVADPWIWLVSERNISTNTRNT
jgi:hypothetical protein